MAKMTSNPLFQSAFEAARAAGWRIERDTKQHWKFIPPDPMKRIVFTSGTPSDHRAVKNFIAELRRQGLVIERKGGVSGLGCCGRKHLWDLR